MKTRILSWAICLGSVALLATNRASANFEVSAGFTINSPADFDQPLATEGAWMQIGTFGRCWHPAVTSTWRPYSTGYWEWTDCGWYWVSDEPWAWACYHYGTWVFDPTAGWVWIPGIEWAPAWVNWRVGGDYIGWAPCGPSGITIDPSAYVFVEGGHFRDHLRPDKVIFNNPTIISRTSEIKNISREERQIGGRTQNVMVNNGPGQDAVEKVTGHRFTPVSVEKVDRDTTRSAPEQLKHRSTEQPTTEQRTTSPEVRNGQRPVEQLPKTSPDINQPRELQPRQDLPANRSLAPRQEMPANRDFTPRQEVPTERSLPPERTVPQTPTERTIPQVPSEKTTPRQYNEVPGNKLQSPKGVVPPSQVPKQPTPATPTGNSGTADKNKDKNQN